MFWGADRSDLICICQEISNFYLIKILSPYYIWAKLPSRCSTFPIMGMITGFPCYPCSFREVVWQTFLLPLTWKGMWKKGRKGVHAKAQSFFLFWQNTLSSCSQSQTFRKYRRKHAEFLWLQTVVWKWASNSPHIIHAYCHGNLNCTLGSLGKKRFLEVLPVSKTQEFREIPMKKKRTKSKFRSSSQTKGQSYFCPWMPTIFWGLHRMWPRKKCNTVYG